MEIYTVEFAPKAQTQRVDLYRYIAEQGAIRNAFDYTEFIAAQCESLRILRTGERVCGE